MKGQTMRTTARNAESTKSEYDVTIVSSENVEESVPIEETAFWKEMDRNRVGNLLAGARLKACLTQAQLAKTLGIRQNMVSDYEHGRRVLSPSMAKRFSSALRINEKYLRRGDSVRGVAATSHKP